MLLDKNSVKAHKNAAKSNASALARTDGVCWWTSVVDLGAVLDDSIFFYNKVLQKIQFWKKKKKKKKKNVSTL